MEHDLTAFPTTLATRQEALYQRELGLVVDRRGGDG